MQFWALLVDSIREALDRKIFWVLMAITLMVALAMFCVSFEADRVSLFFGLWNWENELFNPDTDAGRAAIASIALSIMDFFLGLMGTILMIIACADMFPNMMQRGAIEVVLSKPISRAKLFLYKYVCSMTFVFLIAATFITLTFLVVGSRWHLWRWGYFYCIPLAVLLFSYIYCVTVYVGIRTRSVVASILLSLVMWFVCWSAGLAAVQVKANPALREHRDTPLGQFVSIVGSIPPKTSQITYLAHRWCEASTGEEFVQDMPQSPQMGASGPDGSASGSDSSMAMFEWRNQWAVELYLLKVSAWKSIGSSLLFEAAVVLLAMWTFCRQDF